MNIDREKFNAIKNNNGTFASWAIWPDPGERVKSNMEDLSLFEDLKLDETLRYIHSNFILIGLNISTKDISIPLSNFHGQNGEVYKLRHALKGTKLWGSYMTDIIKDFKEPDSLKIEKYFKNNPEELKDHINLFRNELKYVGSDKSVLVAMGGYVHDILKSTGFENAIIKIPHYGVRWNKEKYRECVISALSNQT